MRRRRQPIRNYPEGKPPTGFRSRFFIERKHCISGYPLHMLYGAAVLAPRKYGQTQTRVHLRIGRLVMPIWAPLLVLAKPFNRYIPGTWAPGFRKYPEKKGTTE